MADIRWIKITTDIFDNRKIRQIESLPDGDKIIVLWLKLLCLAGSINDNGMIYITQEIPYTEQTIATQFNCPLPLVNLAMQTFQQFGMVDVIDNILHISNWERYQNVQGMERIREQTRIRVAKHREKQKQLECNVTVTQSNATDIDKEEDKEKNIDISIPEKITKRFVKPTVEDVENYIKERNFHFDAETFVAYYDSNGWRVGNAPMKNWKACCTTWEKRRYDKQAVKKPTKFHNFDERTNDLDSDIMDTFNNMMK